MIRDIMLHNIIPGRGIFLCLLLFFATSLQAQQIGNGKLQAKHDVLPGNYDFWIYTPAGYAQEGDGLPLVIFLHGKSLSGHNLDRVLKYGVLDAIKKGKNVPAVVLAPQSPGNGWAPNKVKGLMDWVVKNYSIDTSRIYVLGMSMGGYGTMDFVGTYPDKVAAAMALCGGCDLKSYDGLGKLPLWIIHGTADRAVRMDESRKIVRYLEENHEDSLLRYDWIPKATHGTLARVFYVQKTYDWLFKHSTNAAPRMVDTSMTITMADIRNCYREPATASKEDRAMTAVRSRIAHSTLPDNLVPVSSKAVLRESNGLLK